MGDAVDVPLSERARDAIAAWCVSEGYICAGPNALAAIPYGETLPISALLDELVERRAETAALTALAHTMYRWGADSWDYPPGGGFTLSLPHELLPLWRDVRFDAIDRLAGES